MKRCWDSSWLSGALGLGFWAWGSGILTVICNDFLDWYVVLGFWAWGLGFRLLG